MPKPSSKTRARGALAPATLILVSIIAPLAVVSVDGLTLRAAQNRLDIAVEGGATAAARSWSAGTAPERQEAAVRSTADQFVRANLPDTDRLRVDPRLAIRTEAGLRRRTVEVSAEAVVPLSFLRLFGPMEPVVHARSRASRRDLRTVVAVDGSAALLRAGAPDLVERLGAAHVAFEGGAAEGLVAARHALAAADPGALGAIVLLTSGSVRRASDWDAAWDAARRLRRDQALDPLVCVVACGAPAEMLLKMVANARDAGNPVFDASRPAGVYARVRTEQEMRAAFAAVAGEIARATQ